MELVLSLSLSMVSLHAFTMSYMSPPSPPASSRPTEHVQYKHCSLRIKNNRFFLAFSNYTIKKKIGDEPTLSVQLPSRDHPHIHFDSTTTPLSILSSHSFHSSLQQRLTANRISAPSGHQHKLDNHHSTEDSELISVSEDPSLNTTCK